MADFVLFVEVLLALVIDSTSPQENIDTKLIQLAFVSLDLLISVLNMKAKIILCASNSPRQKFTNRFCVI